MSLTHDIYGKAIDLLSNSEMWNLYRAKFYITIILNLTMSTFSKAISPVLEMTR